MTTTLQPTLTDAALELLALLPRDNANSLIRGAATADLLRDLGIDSGITLRCLVNELAAGGIEIVRRRGDGTYRYAVRADCWRKAMRIADEHVAREAVATG